MQQFLTSILLNNSKIQMVDLLADLDWWLSDQFDHLCLTAQLIKHLAVVLRGTGLNPSLQSVTLSPIPIKSFRDSIVHASLFTKSCTLHLIIHCNIYNIDCSSIENFGWLYELQFRPYKQNVHISCTQKVVHSFGLMKLV